MSEICNEIMSFINSISPKELEQNKKVRTKVQGLKRKTELFQKALKEKAQRDSKILGFLDSKSLLMNS